MVNVPSPDKVHVISAWVVAKLKMLRIMSNKDFFINLKAKNKGADFPIVSSSSLGYAQATFTTDKHTEKSMPYTDTELFARLFSSFENWAYSRKREQEQIALCIFMSRESVVAHPS